jgi:aminoglycoside 2'-N-acetyltransferase I
VFNCRIVDMVDMRVVPTRDLSPEELRAVRGLLDEAFEGRFTDADWEHTIGGLHVLVVDDGIASHAAVVDRELAAANRAIRTGYVEGVATAFGHRGRGHATAVMRQVNEIIREKYELGALSTGIPALYIRLGWEKWRGPTFANTPTGRRRTADEDGGVIVLRTDLTRDLDLTTALMCDWRPGDVW